jgi:tetratricopeptide (TPR) repeat protein
LRVPDSEKERQHCIELGIKFFVNASKDEDLFSDALEQLLKAESLMKQDYFVLHRIGCIYLYVEKYINPEKALDYFNRASKYALVESDSKAARLANVLTNNFKTVNSDLNNSGKTIGLLAADSFEKAAFAAYVLGRFSDAVIYQSKALKFNDNTKNRFLLAKYQVRSGETTDGVNNLDKCVDDDPVYSVATFKEIDLINEPEVLHLLKGKNLAINEKIDILIKKLKNLESTEAVSIVKELIDLKEHYIKFDKNDLYKYIISKRMEDILLLKSNHIGISPRRFLIK